MIILEVGWSGEWGKVCEDGGVVGLDCGMGVVVEVGEWDRDWETGAGVEAMKGGGGYGMEGGGSNRGVRWVR